MTSLTIPSAGGPSFRTGEKGNTVRPKRPFLIPHPPLYLLDSSIADLDLDQQLSRSRLWLSAIPFGVPLGAALSLSLPVPSYRVLLQFAIRPSIDAIPWYLLGLGLTNLPIEPSS